MSVETRTVDLLRSRPVVDLRAIPYGWICEPLDAIIQQGQETGEYAFPWIFEALPPHWLVFGDRADGG